MTETLSPMPPSITDSHCHLDFPDFEGELDALIARAAEAGVTRMVTICTKLRNEPTVRAIAEAHAPMFYAAGTHPMSAADEPMATVDELVALAQHPKFVGIGGPGWITTIPPTARTCRRSRCASISPPRGKPACR